MSQTSSFVNTLTSLIYSQFYSLMGRYLVHRVKPREHVSSLLHPEPYVCLQATLQTYPSHLSQLLYISLCRTLHTRVDRSQVSRFTSTQSNDSSKIEYVFKISTIIRIYFLPSPVCSLALTNLSYHLCTHVLTQMSPQATSKPGVLFGNKS